MAYQYNADQRAWLDDLKTTELAQGKDYLNASGSFCCLGRACEVLDIKKKYRESGCMSYGDKVNVATAPNEIVYRINLLGKQGISIRPFNIHGVIPCGGEDFLMSLTHANDSGATFKQIAEAIEADPDNFFSE